MVWKPVAVRCMEHRDKLDISGAIGTVSAVADIVVTACDEDTNATHTERYKKVAQDRCVCLREYWLWIS
jgi:hypothetical protein